MPTRIRLQRRGTRNNPYYLIVVQSDRTNPKGKVIEKTGYYYPDRWSFSEKQIILNRPRLKYWLGVGAQPTKGVFRILGKSGFLPPRPPPFGTATLYEKPPKTYPLSLHPRAAELGAFSHRVEEVLESEEHNKTSKAAKEDRAVYEFTRQPSSSSLSVEMQGVWAKYSRFLDIFHRRYPRGSNEQRKILLDLMNEEHLGKERITPHTLVRELNITEDEARDMLEFYENVSMPFTSADIEDCKVDLSLKSPHMANQGETYIPVKVPLTPVPDFDDNSQNDEAYQLFQKKVQPKPTSKAYGATFKRSIHFLTSPLYFKYII